MPTGNVKVRLRQL